MNTFLFMLASTAVGWLLGSRTAQRRIDRKFAELERRMASAPAQAAAVEAAPKKEEELDEETLLILSATIAAYLGKKARIRRVRRINQPGYNPWSQQGRVSIMGSHDVRHYS